MSLLEDFEPRETNSLKDSDGEDLISVSTFVDVCNAFENILVNVNYSRTEGIIYEKLSHIREIIDQKISPGNILSLSPLTISNQSVCSDYSIPQEVENFMTQVYCPLCAEILESEIALVKHLKNSCVPHQKKEFTKSNHMDYSIYQILPCNQIKCNTCPKSNPFYLIDLNKHSQELLHLKNVDAMRKGRKLVLALYCSCCEVLINYSFKEIIFHLSLERHEVNINNNKLMMKLKNRKDIILYTRSRKFKCSKCKTISKNKIDLESCAKFISSHMACLSSNAGKSNNYCEIYCEVCLTIFTDNDLGHIFSDSHKKMEKNNLMQCFFCSLTFDSLMSLSLHLDSKCPKIMEINKKLQKNPFLEKI